MKTPKISVITVTYNCKDTIELTIQNVLNQTYSNVEYIIIDGNSTDGTREIIERYADRLGYWISEPDKGIYDAMNKGLKVATGEWVLFRNSGDYFFEPTTIQQVFEWYEDNGEDLITGGTRNFYHDGYFDSVYRAVSESVWDKALFSHPSTFIRLKTHLKILFPDNLKIAGDYYFFQKLLVKREHFAIYSGLISLYDCETGVSSRNVIKGWKEKQIALSMLNAPEDVHQKMKKNIRYIKCVSPFLAFVRRYSWSSRIYRSFLYPDWVGQDIGKTLENI
ncbi:MAG: glycosyltransferase [Bacteroidaceae bacterium]|nr:glycosyltransferase [Bacteroidaceae bacterium]